MLTIKNCFFFLELSKLFYLNDLKELLLNIFFKCYLSKFNLTIFFELSFSDLQTLISSSSLQTDSELEIFQSVIDWINYKKSERKNFIDKLLNLVRLPLLTNDLLFNVIQAHPLCSHNEKCKIIIDKALEIKKNKRQFLSSTLLQNRYYCRKFDNKEIKFIGYEDIKEGVYKPLALSYKTDSSEINEIKINSKINQLRKDNVISIVIDTKIYCIGGFHYGNEMEFSRSFEVYCQRTNKWTLLPEIPDYRPDFCACSFMGKIYVFGGLRLTGVNLVYDPDKNSWDEIAQTIKQNRCYSSCTVFNGRCVVVGGDNYSKSVETYDHYLNEWKLLPNMQAGRKLPGLLSKGNKLYVISGGQPKFRHYVGYRNTHEVYDCLTKKFTFIASNSDCMELRYRMSLFTNENSIFVLDNRRTFYDSYGRKIFVPTYDIVENRWYTKTLNCSHRHDFHFTYSILSSQKYLK